jgi:phosphonopyruvate decarboxylase
MKVEKLIELIESDFYVGVPDSQLKPLCNYLMNKFGIDPKHHMIAANEGNCVAISAGYHLATGRIPVVYMQNSGEGNIVNPVASLLNDSVYAIPMVFIVGWRGEPGIHDEPQHIYQGKITIKILEDLDITSFVITKATTDMQVEEVMRRFRKLISLGKQVAFVVGKEALSYDGKVNYSNNHCLLREEIISQVVKISGEDPIICTTGKASRELFEIREFNGQSHKYDFLTVGSMGHSSSIALGIALNKHNRKIWCIDGDGAILMHMGSMAVIGANAPKNMVHIAINNEAHETVGGMPTVASSINFVEIAKACGYVNAISVNDIEKLEVALSDAKYCNELSFIEVKCAIGARENLGRPTTTAIENKEIFMEYMGEIW